MLLFIGIVIAVLKYYTTLWIRNHKTLCHIPGVPEAAKPPPYSNKNPSPIPEPFDRDDEILCRILLKSVYFFHDIHHQIRLHLRQCSTFFFYTLELSHGSAKHCEGSIGVFRTSFQERWIERTRLRGSEDSRKGFFGWWESVAIKRLWRSTLSRKTWTIAIWCGRCVTSLRFCAPWTTSALLNCKITSKTIWTFISLWNMSSEGELYQSIMTNPTENFKEIGVVKIAF